MPPRLTTVRNRVLQARDGSASLEARWARDRWSIEGPSGDADEATLRGLLDALCSACEAEHPGAVEWWARPGSALTDRVARSCGMEPDREIHQLRRPLPIEYETAISTRPFRPGEDDDQWLEVNNRAFVWHEEQGSWTPAELRERIAEPWFDPEGFLIHEREGRIAAFCWTKMHTEERPALGEIYVIGVDPSLQGMGLGRELAIAGLHHLHDHGAPIGMLYVESDNDPAQRLYAGLGFLLHHADRRYRRGTREPGQGAPSRPMAEPTR